MKKILILPTLVILTITFPLFIHDVYATTPTISLSLTSASPGSTVFITGDNFTPNYTISILFDGANPMLLGTSDSVGHFSFPLTIPSGVPAGVYHLTVKDSNSNSATATLTISTTVPPPSLNVDLKDQISCQAAPVSGIWTAATSTCVVTNLTINLGDSLTVDNSVFPNITLEIDGMLFNQGIITNNGVITNSGLVGNYGTVTNSPNSTITNNASGVVDNDGIITNYGMISNSGSITNISVFTNNAGGTVMINLGGTIDNKNSITIPGGGTITNSTGGTITNSGIITNNGTFNNNSQIVNSGNISNNHNFSNAGGLDNNPGGTISNNSGGATINTGNIGNSWSISNSGMFSNIGNIIMVRTGVITNNYFFNNTGTISTLYFPQNWTSALGIMINNVNGIITNSGHIDFLATLTNFGTITNNVGGQIWPNFGVFNNAGTLINHGSNTINNAGYPTGGGIVIAEAKMFNNGTIINPDGFFNIGALGVVVNTGTITLGPASSFSNSGSLVNCGGTISSTQPIGAPPVTCTVTTITSSQNPSVLGQPVTFTATVSSAYSSSIPTGTVAFYDNKTNTSIGNGLVDSNGHATVTTSIFPLGNHDIIAAYDGDNKFWFSKSPVLTQTINKINTTTSLSSSVTTVIPGQLVAFSSIVTSTTSGTPTGNIQFQINGTDFGTPVTLSGGQASLVTSLPTGTDSIVAAYSGDSSSNPSISNPVNITVLTMTDGKVTAGGSIGKDIQFGFKVRSELANTSPVTGHMEYNDKNTNIKFESNKMSFLSVYQTSSKATFAGTCDDKSNLRDFIVTVTDSDNTGNHDVFSISIIDNNGKIIYQNSGTVNGHIEIHKQADDKDDENSHDYDNSK